MITRNAQSGGTARSVNDPTAKGKGPPANDGTAAGRTAAPTSRTEAVQDALRQAIMEQKLQPGARLPEDAIGETFGTSRTIAREALGRLAVEGLVELKPNKGAYVANPSLEEALDTFMVRRGLECTVTGLLAGKLKPGEIDALNSFIEKEHSVSGVDDRESIRLAGEFHLLLARMTGNQLLIRYVTEVVSRCSLILAMYGRPHSADCGVDEHRQIVQALVNGDASRANELMDHHLASVAGRAMLEARQERDIRDLLAPYAARIKGL
ncbi:DNA-binding GntR family transcriptional regulator [Rhizobium leguminosarum]|uniref:DNA-binding GntR family transcriptional regulator n=2 Tax=Rhizobium/Agrobacterium group TaxID=227290 RepID=A0A7W6US28_9HYPH|nr:MULTISPECIES: GntR family transcriptional regulator [Rhizobium]MBB4443308.1 DNA-binding GntR family transcriptional regulator [Rhizobium esperanzae]MDH6206162.1 DNA-binding GntR family transcriptional regulator [Rhizobium leguminosarum]